MLTFVKCNNLLFLLLAVYLNYNAVRAVTVNLGVVDAGGYYILSSLYTGMAMQANPMKAGNFGSVTLEPYNHENRAQKWGVMFYGSETASLSPGLNRENQVTLYHPEGSYWNLTRQYTFTSCDQKETYKIRNYETGQCLLGILRNETYAVELSDCSINSQNFYWIFQRYG